MGPSPVVRLGTGQVRGREDRGVFAFLGLPFAAPPFGSRRMRPPADPEPWSGVRDVVDYGPTVPKGDYAPPFSVVFPERTIPGAECLNLNVWTPDPGAAGLPVLVWIHGGGFTNGSNSVAEYAGHAFARDGVVTVTINYRLGAEGFLHTGDENSNLGLLDQIAALRWVQENIAAFGGDPARVTIAGESAGAMSVTALLTSPLASGMYRQAIAQSGAGSHCLTAAEALFVAEELAQRAGVAADRDSFASIDPDRLAAHVHEVLLEVQGGGDPEKWGEIGKKVIPFAPVIGGAGVPEHPLDAFRAGRAADVPLLIGTNREESRIFLVASGAIDLIDDDLLGAAAATFGLPLAEAVETYRSAEPEMTPGDLLAAISTDWFFRLPAIRVVEAREEAAIRSASWMYRLEWRSPAFGGRYGAAHGVDMPFCFDTLDSPDLAVRLGPSPPQEVADLVHAVWVRFISDGDPGWAAYDQASRTTGLLDRAVTAVDDPDGRERRLWTGLR